MHRPWGSVLRLGQINRLAGELNLVPLTAVLHGQAHPCVYAGNELSQVLWEPRSDGCVKALVFLHSKNDESLIEKISGSGSVSQ